ncbi:MAG TPA: hypothetical protein VFD58_30300 [Blastocatellia bacterium]|nr:hypothetical protein [Blastocatellia bacterium]
MNKPRLIKQGEALQQEYKQTERSQEPEPSAFRVSVESVINWAKEKRRPEPVNAREKFAALFAQPQTE